MIKLGGSLFVHNGVEFDYCFRESIRSLCALCDEVVVIDAESTDDTILQLDKLKWELQLDNLIISQGHKWDCSRYEDKGYDRLAVLANKAKSMLDCEWHFMLQADEVIHENSIPIIRNLINIDTNKTNTFAAKRINLYYNVDHYIREDCGPSTCGVGKPCSDIVWRLGIKRLDAKGDAESIVLDKGDNSHYEKIIIFHYGYVRKPDIMLDKSKNMLEWFWRKGGQPDHILESHREKCGYLIPEERMPDVCFKKLEISHPIFSKDWAQERREIFTKLEKERGR